MSKLTPQQEQVMLYVQRAFARTGHPPVLTDIAAHCEGVASKTRAHTVVAQLIELGYLAKIPNVSRGIVIVKTIPDDRFEEAAKEVCQRLGVVTPANIAIAREAIAQTLMRAA